MGRPKTNMKTKLMRVPISFDLQTNKMTKRYGYKSQTQFLHKEGTTIFENVDFINKMFKPMFWKKKTNVKPKNK